MNITSRTKGRRALLWKTKAMQREGISLVVGLAAKDTHGTVARKKSGPKDVSRGEVENIIVLRSQAKRGFEVAFLYQAEWEELVKFWKVGIARFLEDVDSEKLSRAAKAVAGGILRHTLDHIKRSMTPQGKMKQVQRATEKRKEREVGSIKSPLIKTGQLLEMFDPIVRRVRGRGRLSV